MHGSVQDWVREAIMEAEVKGLDVAEAGSRNWNGSWRNDVEYFQPASYAGIDLSPGPGVDVVMSAADLPLLGEFDLVFSTEMLEHAEDWRAAMAGMITAVKPGGILVITTRSKGFPYHDYEGDYWRYSVLNMRLIMERAGMEIVILISDPDCPGVFVKARKPMKWSFPDNPWEDIILDPPE